MTPKQIYSELAKIAGHCCLSDMKPFLKTKKATKADIVHVQSRMRSLLEKLNYERTFRDFGTMPIPRRPTLDPDGEESPIPL